MDPIRKAFEEVSAPSFPSCGHELSFPKSKTGEYVNPALEDHWQTFQEGWEEAVKYLTNRDNPCYNDVVSNGGMDPRS